jgi:hypothetical protein
MNGRTPEDVSFFEEQLFEARQALFEAKTVREIKFLQTKINYLSQKVSELER